eukprot:gnl/MRDRNA2_/MRDRNA2_109878_c0_seq1.p1 gnl/MRDRNA2_/MRDRNA2_109878_c0~~gnl/MRDRNA2_/MRDRNA2_109878_c0_seq1.p1  ORF type:complete len:260 (-),score=58.06 gnl/MRDRNA2_/MRDRNA2_109878_c0_seq1:10-789(-)
MAETQGLAFFRITVLGMGDSGKTSLINAFVNNFCPTVYTETQDPTLYYKTVRLPSDEDEGKPFSVLVEIEDTYNSARGDDKDCYGNKRDVANFIDMSRSKPVPKAASADAKLSMPLSVYEPPRVGRYNPLTKGRMGFMIVFDANSEKSYTEALNIHMMLEEDLLKKKIRLKPVIYLVANKIDKDPTSNEFQKMIASAQIYSQAKMIRYEEVSALEFKRVKKMFREMLGHIRSNQILWLLDDGDENVTAEEAGGSKCVVQ